MRRLRRSIWERSRSGALEGRRPVEFTGEASRLACTSTEAPQVARPERHAGPIAFKSRGQVAPLVTVSPGRLSSPGHAATTSRPHPRRTTRQALPEHTVAMDRRPPNLIPIDQPTALTDHLHVFLAAHT